MLWEVTQVSHTTQCLQGTWALRPNRPRITIRVTLPPFENCSISGNESYGLQIICSPKHAAEFSTLTCVTLTVPCDHSDLSLPGNLGNALKGAFWYTVTSSRAISDSALITPTISAVVFVACTKPSWWIGARTMDWPSSPCLGRDARVSLLALGKGLKVGRPWSLLGMVLSSHCNLHCNLRLLSLQGHKLNSCWSQPLCHGEELKQPPANHSPFPSIKSEIHSLLLCTKPWPRKPAEKLSWTTVTSLLLSPGVQFCCPGKVSKGIWDALDRTMDLHEDGAGAGLGLTPFQSSIYRAFKTLPGDCVFHAPAETERHVLLYRLSFPT